MVGGGRLTIPSIEIMAYCSATLAVIGNGTFKIGTIKRFGRVEDDFLPSKSPKSKGTTATVSLTPFFGENG